MKKHAVILTIVFFSLAVFTASTFADLLKRAPDVLPGTNPEFRDPEYWIAKMVKPDEVILSIEAIQQMNEDYQKKVKAPDPFRGVSKERTPDLSHWWPGYVMTAPDLHSMSPSEAADTVRARIRIQIDYLRDSKYGHAQAVEYRDEDIDSFENEMALDRVSNNIKLQKGIAVRTTRLRNVPSFPPLEIGLTDSGERRFDMFNVCVLKIGKPVTVLHPSRSGEYVLVLSDDAFGWARSEDIAFCDRKTQDAFVNAGDFVVCTGDRVMYYSDESCIYASGWFGMGDHLPLVKRRNPRIIKAPVRMPDGNLVLKDAWLAVDTDVSVGFLPYTRRNIVTTAFKLMDNPYDFTGGWFGRNHETTYRDIFACFGFELPFHGVLFTHYSNTEAVAFPDPDNKSKAQFQVILEHEPFVTIHCSGGHAQFLLGEENGVPIVFDHHGYKYKGDDGIEYIVRRTCVGPMNNPGITGYMLRRPLTIMELK